MATKTKTYAASMRGTISFAVDVQAPTLEEAVTKARDIEAHIGKIISTMEADVTDWNVRLDGVYENER